MNFLELKNKIAELKNSVNGLTSNRTHHKTELVYSKTIQQKISKLKHRKRREKREKTENKRHIRFSKMVYMCKQGLKLEDRLNIEKEFER